MHNDAALCNLQSLPYHLLFSNWWKETEYLEVGIISVILLCLSPFWRRAFLPSPIDLPACPDGEQVFDTISIDANSAWASVS